MVDEKELKSRIQSLLSDYNSLSNKDGEAEKRTEDFVKKVFWQRYAIDICLKQMKIFV